MPLQVVGVGIEGDRTMEDLWPLQVGFNQGHLLAPGYVVCYVYLVWTISYNFCGMQECMCMHV